MDNQDRKVQSPPPRLSSTSYVYPVKSLLEGRIQPAAECPATSSRSLDNTASLLAPDLKAPVRARSETVADWAANTSSLVRQSSEPDKAPGVFTPETLVVQKVKGTRRRAPSPSSVPPVDQDKDQLKQEASLTKTKRKKTKSKAQPNISHFPSSHNPYFPRTFSSICPSERASISEPLSLAHLETLPSGMSADSFLGHGNPDRLQVNSSLPMISSSFLPNVDNQPQIPPHPIENSATKINSTLTDAMAITQTRPPPMQENQTTSFSNQRQGFYADPLATPIAQYPSEATRELKDEDDEPTLPFNPSEYGFVHLPPLPPSRSNSERGSSATSSAPRSGRSGTNSVVKNFLRSSHAQSLAGSGSGGSKAGSASSGFNSGRASSGQSSQREFTSEVFSSDENRSSVVSDDPYISVRFQSMQDEDGHHVVVGREGKLLRCEDEPIRTPGAVQGFGVLIAIDELEDTLVVRQVSENSTELLGLPPRYLFGLECFTDTLPETQANIIWDNIEFLSDPSLESDDDDGGPHVFLLSGWGAPGSALPHELDAVDGKKSWTCWCAVHRTTGYSSTGSTSSGLIVMEFELERDILNPLYPPVPAPSVRTSGAASPLSSEPTGSDETATTGPDLGSDQSTAGNSSRSGAGSLTPSLLSSISPELEKELPASPLFQGLVGENEWRPSAQDIIESTTSRSKPLPALERLRRMTRGAAPYGEASQAHASANPPAPSSSTNTRRGGRRVSRGRAVGMMDVFAVMAQINEQLGAAPDLDTFLKVVVGVIKDLTQFHRVMIYQFDELWNGQVVAELMDWSQSHDLFSGLHFPATDIPAQARHLYTLNKVRLLYDVSQPTARIVVRDKEDLDTPLDMTHCYLRAMSPIHITYLQNMGVRASMSVSVMGFGQLWGLITCHTYGPYGMRVSFPVRQMLRLLSQSISKNIERLSYAQRLHTRKLVNTMVSDQHPTGYIVSNTDDLLGLFDADFGILVIGEGAKILGPNQHGQEILIMAEYLRLKQYDTIQASQAVLKDFPDLELTTGFEIIAGLLYVPLSTGGKDFIAFLRRGQPRQVHWAGRPFKEGQESGASLEPRKSFKVWSETVAGRCRAWTEEQLGTAGVLALVYGKFIEVWREKETALQTNKLTDLLLSNASHEVRTPLNHIINYLEMAMHGHLDEETRDNLSKSHAASKSLLFTINDLLDLTRLETGNETSFNEPFNLRLAIEEATHLYRKEARRRNIEFILDLRDGPTIVVGDMKKIRTVVQNLTANALKYTTSGSITVSCSTFGEPEGLRDIDQTAVEIIVADTGCGIAPDKLESIFREFEQVESSEPKSNKEAGVGLGLAVVARIVEQIEGQLRVDSTVNEGSRFSFLIPLSLSIGGSASRSEGNSRSSGSSRESPRIHSRSLSLVSASAGAEIEDLVNALSFNHMAPLSRETTSNHLGETRSREGTPHRPPFRARHSTSSAGGLEVSGSQLHVFPVKTDVDGGGPPTTDRIGQQSNSRAVLLPSSTVTRETGLTKLRVLIVEDNDINRTILAKRLTLNGHAVVNSTNGQEGFDKVVADPPFDVVLMDIQMPIMNGFEASRRIRDFEKDMENHSFQSSRRPSLVLNGRLPIFAVSASLNEHQREELVQHGMDGWILKPIDFRRLNDILKGVTDATQRRRDIYRPGCNWEAGGWLTELPSE
ncbi:hypothetical protein GALMADRAFT_238000 [Galerina marginata CBS 339.88]|uniref:Phytochrome n=1 Tax=Galerina marginata (strain CBS 339.88) TaxID=685588 RepID=A0A067THI7_GALM3|nr:hypothetical protein GALMADRAFT_238000 [Galerina marginata CBS 339.88]